MLIEWLICYNNFYVGIFEEPDADGFSEKSKYSKISFRKGKWDWVSSILLWSLLKSNY